VIAVEFNTSEPTISNVIHGKGAYAPPHAYPRDLIEAAIRSES
jgi:hypothetical protein